MLAWGSLSLLPTAVEDEHDFRIFRRGHQIMEPGEIQNFIWHTKFQLSSMNGSSPNCFHIFGSRWCACLYSIRN